MRASTGETATLIWTDREWRGEAHAWIDDQLTRLGRRRTGEVEQPHARPWSTVMLVPTDNGPVWFKAAGSGTGYEVRLLEALAGWESPMILAPLAIDPERAWILLPDAGTRLRDHLNGAAGVDEWLRILPAYASLQRWITPRATDLIALGVPDLRPAVMPDRLRALIDHPRTGLGDADLARVRQLLPV